MKSGGGGYIYDYVFSRGFGGEDPNRKIWYFRGLRLFEAKIMVELLNICFIEILIWRG